MTLAALERLLQVISKQQITVIGNTTMSMILKETHGKTVQNTESSEEKVIFHFSDGTSFVINLTDPKLSKDKKSANSEEGKFVPKSECQTINRPAT